MGEILSNQFSAGAFDKRPSSRKRDILASTEKRKLVEVKEEKRVDFEKKACKDNHLTRDHFVRLTLFRFSLFTFGQFYLNCFRLG